MILNIIKIILFGMTSAILSCAPFSQKEPIEKGVVDEESFAAQNINSNEICITSHNSDRNGYVEKSIKFHENYSENRYQYQFYTGRISGELYRDETNSKQVLREGLYWQKVAAVQKQLERPECRWVLWIDADAVFTNKDKKIESIIKNFGFRKLGDISSENYLIIPKDETEHPRVVINNGVFLVRNNSWSKNFFKKIESLYSKYKDYPFPEQDAFQDVIYQLDESAKTRSYETRKATDYESSKIIPHVFIIPQRVMDSFYRSWYKDSASVHWKRCDFIAHLSGISNQSRLDILGNIEQEMTQFPCN